MKHPAIRITVRCACFLVLAALARAETFKVSSGLAADLQAAIDAAAPGDTISLSGGPYTGNFTVPAGKDGLTIKGKVFIDAQGDTHGFVVDSNDVTFSALTIRHAPGSGLFGPQAGTLSGITISKCTFIACLDTAVDVDADDAEIKSCVAVGCGSGFLLIGNRAVVTKSKAFQMEDSALVVQGDDAEVFKNTVVTAGSDGVSVSGDDAQVTDNRVTNVGGSGVFATGERALVTGNTVEGAGTFGLFVSGADATTSKNDVDGSLGVGILTTGADVVVSHNSVANTSEGSAGILVQSTDDPIIEKNRVEDTGGPGFSLTVDGATITGNRAERCGVPFEGGFSVSGDDNLLDGNVAEDCIPSGFLLDGSDNLLQHNVATGNGDDGYWVLGVGSVDNVFDDNLAKGNHGEGLQNGGVGTLLRDNAFKKNLLDLANETGAGATLIDDGGNTFETGGLTVEPVILS